MTTWQDVLDAERKKPYYARLQRKLSEERARAEFSRKMGGEIRIYPPAGQELRALAYTPLESVDEVWIGQDPYHGPGQAHGLSFSVPSGVKPPYSLVQIFKELNSDLGIPIPTSGDLSGLASAGTLLLNTVLTVEKGKPKSHAKGRFSLWGGALGLWEPLTLALLQAVAAQPRVVFWLCLGSDAAKLAYAATKTPNQASLQQGVWPAPIIIDVPHPAADRYGREWRFRGSKPFSQMNAIHERMGLPPKDYRAALANPTNPAQEYLL